MNVTLPLEAVLDDPTSIATFSQEVATEVLKQLLARGLTDVCFQAIKKAGYLDYSGVVTSPQYHYALLDEMVAHGEVIEDLCNLSIGRHGAQEHLFRKHRLFFDAKASLWITPSYWLRLISYELSQRDTLRAWETIKAAYNGFRKRARLEPHLLRGSVDGLHDLMIEKGQIDPFTSTSPDLPTKIDYPVKERRRSKADRRGRSHKARTYTQRGKAPGADLAEEFNLGSPDWKIDLTGQKILAIAMYFNRKKK